MVGMTDEEMIKNKSAWPGETLCLKKRLLPGEVRNSSFGYTTFGVILDNQFPISILIQPDFAEEYSYNTLDNLLADGWIVD
jgi:hypothetical protein